MARFRNSSTSTRIVHLVELPPRPLRRRGTVHQGPQPSPSAATEPAPLRVVTMRPAAPAPSARELDPGLGEAESPYRQQVGLLERRLRKLTNVLEQQEAMLARMQVGPAVETGLASVYREVQGLDDAVPEAERKREMMQAIFTANMQLRESISG